MNTITEQSAIDPGRGGGDGTATIFGVDLAVPDSDALAASQQAFQDLRDAAGQARAAAEQAATPEQAEYARRLAAVADAVSNGNVPGLQDGVNGVVSFVSQHPELAGSQASAFASSANSALSQIQAAIQLIGQANDPASAANAIDASANAVAATGTWVGVAAGLIGVGGPVVAGILAIGGLLVAIAHGIANLIRPSQDASPTSDTPAQTTNTPASRRSDNDNDPDTDTDTDTQTDQPTSTDTRTQTNQPTDTDTDTLTQTDIATDPTTTKNPGDDLGIDTAGPATSGRTTSSFSSGGGGNAGPGFTDPSSTIPAGFEEGFHPADAPKKKEAEDDTR